MFWYVPMCRNPCDGIHLLQSYLHYCDLDLKVMLSIICGLSRLVVKLMVGIAKL